MRILVADDSRTSRTILSSMLEKWDYEPVLVENGIAAWDAFQGLGAPGLAILDWNMPGMNGLEVCRRVRHLNLSDQPYIIMLTGRERKEDIVSGLEAGANDYISKPFDNSELRARIKVGQRMVEMQREINKAMNALAYEATHDTLTSTLNRRAILDILEKEIVRAKRESTLLAIGLFDIDHFKKINDTLGHRAGDEVISGFARIIEGHIRVYDFLGRFGGEEFLLITPSQNNKIQGVYDRLCRAVSQSEMQTKAGPVSITVSVGVAFRAANSTVDEMLEVADRALYKAKEEGRNRVVYAIDTSSQKGRTLKN